MINSLSERNLNNKFETKKFQLYKKKKYIYIYIYIKCINNNSQKNLTHFKKNNINQKHKKLYTCKNREMESTSGNFLIYTENKLSIIEFRE